MPLIEVNNLTMSYEGRRVLEGLSFSVAPGDYVCILGENGSGKSTLMKGLLSLKVPESGEIVLGEGLRRGQIGYLPQQSTVERDFPASVWEIVLSGCQNGLGRRLFYGRAARARARACMERLGIAALARRPWRELSGGQQQRVLLCRALCATQRLLLMDEPVAGLDPAVTAELYALIRKENREGMTVIMISHDVGTALTDATHVLQLGRERCFFGTVEQYRQSGAYGELTGGGRDA